MLLLWGQSLQLIWWADARAPWLTPLPSYNDWPLWLDIHKLVDVLQFNPRPFALSSLSLCPMIFLFVQEKELAVAAGKLAECQKTIASLGQQLKALATLEDLFDSDMSEPNEVSPVLSGEQSTSYSNEVYCSKKVEPSNTVDDYSPSNSKDEEQLPSSSSSSTNHDSEKSRNGFRKLFFRNKNGSSRIENQ